MESKDPIGADYIAGVMQAYGVSHVFFVPQILTKSIASMDALGIQGVMAHGEKAAAYMADGYARATRRVGVCMAQRIGGANLAAGLKDAAMASVPVIALTGGSNPEHSGKKVYQEVDDHEMFWPVVKSNQRLEVIEQLRDMLPGAFRLATSGRPGPVHLEVAGHFGERIEEGNSPGKVDVDLRFGSVPPYRPEPEPASVDAVASALSAAARPLIIAGGGVPVSGGSRALVELAEKLSIPVATSLTAKGAIPETHPLAIGVVGLYSRESANRIAAESDLVFFVGSDIGGQISNRWKLLAPGTRVIQLNIDAEALGQHYRPEVTMLCDAQRGLEALLAQVEKEERPKWLGRVKEIQDPWRERLDALMHDDEGPMRPDRMWKEVSQAMPEDAVVVCDTGHAAMWACQSLDIRHSTQKFIRCEGSLGWCLPAAIGAKAGLPERPVIGITGDGGFYYHIAELETAVRYGLNVVMVINDNTSLNQELPDIQTAYPEGETENAERLWRFSPVDLAEVARGLGCDGVTASSPDELASLVAESGTRTRPLVIVAKSDREVLAPRAWSAA